MSNRSGRSPALDGLLGEIRACRICRDTPAGRPLQHEPRPVLQASDTARLCIVGQAPGTRVHASGRPFTDPSGDRLRDWMGIDEEVFYDENRVAIIPMGFCFPGLDSKGGDRPPRRECAPAWRTRLFELLPQIELLIVIGMYAQKWHLGEHNRENLTATVTAWREIDKQVRGPSVLPLPHPSWRNNAWLKRHPWFDRDLVPELRRRVAKLV